MKKLLSFILIFISSIIFAQNLSVNNSIISNKRVPIWDITDLIADSNSTFTPKDLITNGTFDDSTGWTFWEPDNTWKIEGGKLKKDVSTTWKSVRDSVQRILNKLYHYEFDANRTSGTAYFSFGSTSVKTIASSGHYSDTATWTNVNALVQFGSSNYIGTIDNLQVYPDSATTGDWTLVGNYSIDASNDSTLLYDNIPGELNPNVNFDNWSYVNIVSNGIFNDSTDWVVESEWDITSGTANANNLIASHSIYQAGKLTIGKFYRFKFDVVNYTSGTLSAMMGLSTPKIYASAVGTYINVDTALGTNQVRFEGAGFTGSIDNVSVAKLIPPDGWTFDATMDDSLYVIQNNGLRFVNLSSGAWASLYRNVGLTPGVQYIYELNLTKNGVANLLFQEGDNTTIKNIGTSSSIIDTFTATQSNNIKFKTASPIQDCDWTITHFSLKSYYPSNYISLPLINFKKKKYKIVYDYKEGATNLIQNGTFDDSTGWTFPSGTEWTIENGKLIRNIATAWGTARYMFPVNATQNKLYRYEFDLIRTSGSLAFYFGNTLINSYNTTMHVSDTATWTDIQVGYTQLGSSTFTGNVDNFKIYEVSDNEQTVEQAKIHYSLAGVEDSTNVTTNSWQKEGRVIRSNVNADSNYYWFDGVDDYIEINYTPVLDFQDSITIYAKVNIKDNSKERIIYAAYSNGSWNERLRLSYLGQIQFTLRDTSGIVKSCYSPDLGYVGEHIIAATYNNGVAKLYIDGFLKNTINMSILNKTGSGNRTIGMQGAGSPFYGEVFDIKLYNRALTQSEVTTLYNGGTVSGAVLDLEPENMTTSTWTDASGNGNDGTVNGAIMKQTELKLWLDEQGKVKLDNFKLYEKK